MTQNLSTVQQSPSSIKFGRVRIAKQFCWKVIFDSQVPQIEIEFFPEKFKFYGNT